MKAILPPIERARNHAAEELLTHLTNAAFLALVGACGDIKVRDAAAALLVALAEACDRRPEATPP